MNLIEGINNELRRNRELLKEYESIPAGQFGAYFLKQAIARGEKSLEGGDLLKCLQLIRN